MDETHEVIDTFRNAIEADFLRGLLREHGFAARVTRPKLASSLSRLAGGYAVAVPAGKAGRARALLAELARAAAEAGDAEGEEAEEPAAPEPRHAAAWIRRLFGLGPRRD